MIKIMKNSAIFSLRQALYVCAWSFFVGVNYLVFLGVFYVLGGAEFARSILVNSTVWYHAVLIAAISCFHQLVPVHRLKKRFIKCILSPIFWCVIGMIGVSVTLLMGQVDFGAFIGALIVSIIGLSAFDLVCVPSLFRDNTSLSISQLA